MLAIFNFRLVNIDKFYCVRKGYHLGKGLRKSKQGISNSIDPESRKMQIEILWSSVKTFIPNIQLQREHLKRNTLFISKGSNTMPLHNKKTETILQFE